MLMKGKNKKHQLIVQLLLSILVLGGVWYHNSCQRSIYPPQQLELPQLTKSVSSQIIEHEGYSLSYNSDWLLPNWVAYELTAAEVDGDIPRATHFYQDPLVVGAQADKDDFRNSGYDRGHMVAADDMKWSETAMRHSFYLTNVCPQIPNFNAGIWKSFEIKGQKWAVQYGKVYIVCGPVVTNGKYGTIGKNKVVVPDGFYKVFLVDNNGRYEALGLLFDHVAGRKKMKNYACSIDSVEKVTGIDFFCRLPDEVESRVESQVNYSVWGLK